MKLPFELTPETSPDIPNEYTKGIQYFRTGEAQVPWDGYYANYNGANLAVANAFGVWFEIRKRDSSWEAYRLARYSLHLKVWPCDGVNLSLLMKTGEPLPTSQAATPASSYHSNQEPREVPIRTMHLSYTPQQLPPYPPRRPKGTRDDPFGVGNLDSGEEDKRDHKPRQLEGIPPDAFTGDRSKTISFLAEFKHFCRLNHKADLIRDPFKKSSYFLSLVKGPDVKGWVLLTR